jgi:hypothetical protein
LGRTTSKHVTHQHPSSHHWSCVATLVGEGITAAIAVSSSNARRAAASSDAIKEQQAGKTGRII